MYIFLVDQSQKFKKGNKFNVCRPDGCYYYNRNCFPF